MKCTACNEVFKSVAVDGIVTCTNCGKKYRVKSKPIDDESLAGEKVVKLADEKEKKKVVENQYDKLVKKEVKQVSKEVRQEPKEVRQEPKSAASNDYEEDYYGLGELQTTITAKEENFDEFEEPENKVVIKKEKIKHLANTSDVGLTLIDYAVTSVINVVPIAGLLVTILGCFGLVFKKKAGFRDYFNWLLICDALLLVGAAVLFKMVDIQRIIMSLPLR